MQPASVVNQPLTHVSHVLRRVRRLGAVVIGLFMMLSFASLGATAAHAAAQPGDTVRIGDGVGYGTTKLFPIWHDDVADRAPDAWAYSIEQQLSANTDVSGVVAGADQYLGANLYLDSISQVAWVTSHSYPALSLEAFATAASVPDLTVNDAIEATQYAIWSFTDVGAGDAPWLWSSAASEAAYAYLVAGASAHLSITTTTTIAAPSEPQAAGTLVGPFTVHTSEPFVTATTDTGFSIVDANGEAVDTHNVIDGEELYLDIRDSINLGSATLTLHRTTSPGNNLIVNVPANAGEIADAANHAQTLALVSAPVAQVADFAEITWSGDPLASDEELEETAPEPEEAANPADETEANGSSSSDDNEAAPLQADDSAASSLSDSSAAENDSAGVETQTDGSLEDTTAAADTPEVTNAASETNDLPTTGNANHMLLSVAALLAVLSGVALLVNREKHIEHRR